MYYADKKVFETKGKKMMFIRTNCDRKSQCSGIMTEPLNPLVASPAVSKTFSAEKNPPVENWLN